MHDVLVSKLNSWRRVWNKEACNRTWHILQSNSLEIYELKTCSFMLNISQGFYFPIVLEGRTPNLNIRQAFSKDVMYMNSLILILWRASFKNISTESRKESRGTKHIMYHCHNLLYMHLFMDHHNPFP